MIHYITGTQYKGAAYNSCNINFRFTNKTPVIFHNLKGYDSHLIVQEIGKFESKISEFQQFRKIYDFFLRRKFEIH